MPEWNTVVVSPWKVAKFKHWPAEVTIPLYTSIPSSLNRHLLAFIFALNHPCACPCGTSCPPFHCLPNCLPAVSTPLQVRPFLSGGAGRRLREFCIALPTIEFAVNPYNVSHRLWLRVVEQSLDFRDCIVVKHLLGEQSLTMTAFQLAYHLPCLDHHIITYRTTLPLD